MNIIESIRLVLEMNNLLKVATTRGAIGGAIGGAGIAGYKMGKSNWQQGVKDQLDSTGPMKAIKNTISRFTKAKEALVD